MRGFLVSLSQNFNKIYLMKKVMLCIKTLEGYIHDSIKLTQFDAPSAGVFCCSVVELLGRFLRLHNISVKNKKTYMPHKEWFYDFIEKYLRNKNEKYFEHRYLLWKLLRCESAHAVLAVTGITWSGDTWIKANHLLGHVDPRSNRKSLLIYTSKFVQDIDDAVSDFFNDVKKNKTLENNCQKSFAEMYAYGQNVIEGEVKNKNLLIEVSGEINIG